jgi:putative glutamine amidotransferase
VREAGGIPVVLPPVTSIPDVLARLDGLVLTGGGDIDPGRYGAPADPHTSGVNPARDEAELGLLAAALAAGLPVLGICRGLQLINVARGGTLCQHVPNDDGHTPAPGSYGSHRVRIAVGTRLAAILGDGEFDVPTAHHQAIDRLGKGLIAAAWTSDGIAEAVEASPLGRPGDQFLLAVQWHPEAGTDPRLMQALVDAASARAISSRLPQLAG